METFWRLLGGYGTRNPSPIFDSDDVYPVHMLDDTKTLRGIVVAWTLCFNDALDADKLHASLSRLLEIGDWRKVGGRLRLKENGKLEIHVPHVFTAERPAVFYSHRVLAMNIEEHELAKTLPRSTERPSIQPGPQCFRAFAAREDAPSTLEDFVYQDTPQLSLHISSFNDATIVGLSWPHTLMDVMGQQALLRGWCLVLAGRESEVPPMLGAREDAITVAADAPVEQEDEFGLEHKQLKGWAMSKFGLRFGWDLLQNRVVETRTIFLPKQTVAELRCRAHNDMKSTQDDDTETLFISDGDVLTAWAVRAIASSQPQPRPVTVLHALNMRFRLPSLVQAPGVFVQNMAVAAFTFLSATVATGPLGPIALANRRHLAEQATEPQVLAFLRKLRRESKTGCDPATVLCSEPDALLIPFTNWTRANFFQTVDFSPALVQAGEVCESRTNPPGTMIFHLADSMHQSIATRNVVVVLGKDHGGNYWLTGTLSPPAWEALRDDMSSL